MPERPLRVLIYGSCVSRDVFEFFEPADGIELVEYVARSSMISAMSKRPFEGVDVDAIQSAFRRRMVGWDLGSTKVKDLIAEADFDIILIDLIDERYPLLRRGRETFATDSSEFEETGFVETSERRLDWRSRERLAAWRRAWRRLARELKRAKKLDAVRLNRAFWATKMSDGTDYPGVAVNPAAHGQVNAVLAQMYAWIERDLDLSQVYDYEDSELTADTEHKWGTAPYHFPPAYNQRLKANLLAERRQLRSLD
ncbi:MAG: DUF6270 domain-containing protein [Bifidobacteriaceae bacterium]|jgi:hypothetical protein|nr:DUF6270 domain-containing protein [Bifidobacteriaceae bacterium]